MCSDCDAIRQVRVQFADEGKGYTKRFERYILELLQHTTIKRVPAHVRMSWHTVKEIQKRYLSQKFSRPSARGAIPGQDYFRTVIKAGINETIIVSPARVIHRITTPLKETMGPPRFVAYLFLGAPTLIPAVLPGSHLYRSLCVGFRKANTIADCSYEVTRLNCFEECCLSCGPQDSLCTLRISRSVILDSLLHIRNT